MSGYELLEALLWRGLVGLPVAVDGEFWRERKYGKTSERAVDLGGIGVLLLSQITKEVGVSAGDSSLLGVQC